MSNFKSFHFERALESNTIYHKCKEYWVNTISSIAKHHFTEWLTTVYGNGEPMMDGDPIYSALFQDLNKAIKIVHVPLDNSTPNVFITIMTFADTLPFLYVAVQPREISYALSANAIEHWLYDGNNKMNTVIDYRNDENQIVQYTILPGMIYYKHYPLQEHKNPDWVLNALDYDTENDVDLVMERIIRWKN